MTATATLTLTEAIQTTLAYADLFDHPLTAAETHRYLHRYAAPPHTVQAELNNLTTAHQITQQNNLYTLPHRTEIIATRAKRETLAATLWPHAWRYGRWLARTPFTRMVAVTGSLAVNNPDQQADIDYMIITATERVWLCRLLALLPVRYARRHGLEICPNFFLSQSALSMTTRNLYTARELTQMVPLSGTAVYNQLRQANPWTADWLPNGHGQPPHPWQHIPLNIASPPKQAAEKLLDFTLANKLETWERTRKIAKFTAQGINDETSFSAIQCKGHFDGHQTKTLTKLKQTPDMKSAPQTDILLGQSYYLRFDPKLWEAMKPYPPLGTMYAAAYLRDQGYAVRLFDAMLAKSTAEWQTQLQQHQPRYAVIYEDNFNYLSKMCLLNMREAAMEMIAYAKAAGATVILCGSDTTDHPEIYLEGGADFVLQGEGEESLAELLAVLSGKQTGDLDFIQGVARLDDGRVKRNLPRPNMKSIDHLPFPAWDLIDVEAYRQIWVSHHGYFSMNMVTTRGCPYHCNWCAKPIWGQRYASRSAENVAEELAWLKATYAPDHIWFADDIMGLKPNWWLQFADEVEKREIRTPFKCLSRADLIVRRPDNVTALQRAGCEIVWIGAESGAQKVLDAMEKGTSVAQIYEAAASLKAAGVKVAFFLQFGYPGETRQDLESTLQMVRDCQPHDVGMSVSYPLPGTTFHERVKLELGSQQNWTDSADLAMMYQGPFSTAFYRQLHSVLHKEFRSRKGWELLQRDVTQPSKWRVAHLRELLAIVYRLTTLPWARWQLDRLAQASSQAPTTLPHMSLADAAQPSPQTTE